jgi:hypothetical protein
MYLKSNEQFEQFVLRQSLCYVTGSDSIGKKLTQFQNQKSEIRRHKSEITNRQGLLNL